MVKTLKIIVFLIIGALVGSVIWAAALPEYGPSYTIFNTGSAASSTTVYINTYYYPSLAQSPATFSGQLQSSLTGAKYKVTCNTQLETYAPGQPTPEIDSPIDTGSNPISNLYSSTSQQGGQLAFCSVSLPPGYAPGAFNYSASGSGGTSGSYTLSLTSLNNAYNPIIITIPLQSGQISTTSSSVSTTSSSSTTSSMPTTTMIPVNGTTASTSSIVATTSIAATTTIPCALAVNGSCGAIPPNGTGGYINTGTALGAVIGLMLAFSGDTKRRKK